MINDLKIVKSIRVDYSTMIVKVEKDENEDEIEFATKHSRVSTTRTKCDMLENALNAGYYIEVIPKYDNSCLIFYIFDNDIQTFNISVEIPLEG